MTSRRSFLRSGAVPGGLAAALVAAALPSPAPGDVVSHTDRGSVKGRGLTSNERRALDIDKVTATGSPAGLMVAVDLKGNAEKRLGRSNLKRALVAIVLEPKSRSARPSVLGTRGPGPVGQTLRITSTANVAVTRDGDRLVFSILGGGLENVRRIQVMTFASAKARGATTAGFGSPFGARPVDVDALSAPDPGEKPCPSISAMRVEKEAEAERARRDLETARREASSSEDDVDDLEEELDKEEDETADPEKLRRLEERLRDARRRFADAQAAKKKLEELVESLERQETDLFVIEQEILCGTPVSPLDIFGHDHGAMGFGNVCASVDTNMTRGDATLTLEGPPGSIEPPVTQTVPLDSNGNATAIWRVSDPNATYTVRGSASGDKGTIEFRPQSLNFTNVNAQGRTCGPN